MVLEHLNDETWYNDWHVLPRELRFIKFDYSTSHHPIVIASDYFSLFPLKVGIRTYLLFLVELLPSYQLSGLEVKMLHSLKTWHILKELIYNVPCDTCILWRYPMDPIPSALD